MDIINTLCVGTPHWGSLGGCDRENDRDSAAEPAGPGVPGKETGRGGGGEEGAPENRSPVWGCQSSRAEGVKACALSELAKKVKKKKN